MVTVEIYFERKFFILQYCMCISGVYVGNSLVIPVS